jgi:hypothetical protein
MALMGERTAEDEDKVKARLALQLLRQSLHHLRGRLTRLTHLHHLPSHHHKTTT